MAPNMPNQPAMSEKDCHDYNKTNHGSPADGSDHVEIVEESVNMSKMMTAQMLNNIQKRKTELHLNFLDF